MPNQREMIFDSIGKVTFRKNKANKYIRLSVKQDGRVLVTLPSRAAWRHAEKFVRQKLAWIEEQQQKLQQSTKQDGLVPIIMPSQSELDQAQRMIFNRLDELAAKCGYQYRKASFRNQKTIWGSCSHDNNISLNINLIHLPSHLIDYVLLHELVHTKVKNHSSRFWQTLDKCFGCAGAGKKLKKELNNFKPGYRCI